MGSSAKGYVLIVFFSNNVLRNGSGTSNVLASYDWKYFQFDKADELWYGDIFKEPKVRRERLVFKQSYLKWWNALWKFRRVATAENIYWGDQNIWDTTWWPSIIKVTKPTHEQIKGIQSNSIPVACSLAIFPHQLTAQLSYREEPAIAHYICLYTGTTYGA